MNPADITKALHRHYPGVRIQASSHPVLRGHYLVTMPERTAGEIGAVASGASPASRQRASELITRWTGVSLWVSAVRPVRRRAAQERRCEITLRDENSLDMTQAR